MSELITLHPEYAEWIKNIGVNFKQCQIKAASRVNEEMLKFYWKLGRGIASLVNQADYGTNFYQNLSIDLQKELPDVKSFSVTNLKYMANVNGHVYFIRLKEGVNNKFVLRILVSPEYRELIRSVCVGGIDKRQLNKEHIEDFPIICPPSDRVNEYVAFVEQVDKSKVIDTNIIPRGGFYNGNEFCISK